MYANSIFCLQKASIVTVMFHALNESAVFADEFLFTLDLFLINNFVMLL